MYCASVAVVCCEVPNFIQQLRVLCVFLNFLNQAGIKRDEKQKFGGVRAAQIHDGPKLKRAEKRAQLTPPSEKLPKIFVCDEGGFWKYIGNSRMNFFSLSLCMNTFFFCFVFFGTRESCAGAFLCCFFFWECSFFLLFSLPSLPKYPRWKCQMKNFFFLCP